MDKNATLFIDRFNQTLTKLAAKGDVEIVGKNVKTPKMQEAEMAPYEGSTAVGFPRKRKPMRDFSESALKRLKSMGRAVKPKFGKAKSWVKSALTTKMKNRLSMGELFENLGKWKKPATRIRESGYKDEDQIEKEKKLTIPSDWRTEN